MLYQLSCFPGPSGHYLLNSQPRCVGPYTRAGDTVLNEWGRIRELSAVPGLQAQCILLLFNTPALVLAASLKEEY